MVVPLAARLGPAPLLLVLVTCLSCLVVALGAAAAALGLGLALDVSLALVTSAGEKAMTSVVVPARARAVGFCRRLQLLSATAVGLPKALCGLVAEVGGYCLPRP